MPCYSVTEYSLPVGTSIMSLNSQVFDRKVDNGWFVLYIQAVCVQGKNNPNIVNIPVKKNVKKTEVVRHGASILWKAVQHSLPESTGTISLNSKLVTEMLLTMVGVFFTKKWFWRRA